MFKNINKITTYCDTLRINFRLSKRKRNFPYKDKVLYLNDQTILNKNIHKHRYWYKFKYCINFNFHNKSKNILNRKI
jgi:hypothetical protein